jgi:O-methyltransferase involved in polyketide biosynthesis
MTESANAAASAGAPSATQDADRVALTDIERIVDVTRPSVARVYDYILGGANNFAVDRQFAKLQLDTFPDVKLAMATNRAFLGRAVREAVRAGFRQFVDIGSGLPSVGNVHEIADRTDPEASCRVVYIDNEPIAVQHAAILLDRDADPTRHHAIAADFYDYEHLWQQVVDTGLIDLSQPVCLLAVALLHFMPADTHPERALAWYRGQLPSGSWLVLSHVSNDEQPSEAAAAAVANYARSSNPVVFRTRSEVSSLFGDFDLLAPGLTWAPAWRPDPGVTHDVDDPALSKILVGVAEKPRT